MKGVVPPEPVRGVNGATVTPTVAAGGAAPVVAVTATLMVSEKVAVAVAPLASVTVTV